MQISLLQWVVISSVLAIFFTFSTDWSYGQIQSSTRSDSTNSSASPNSVVAVSSSVTVPVMNQTAKTSEATLRSGVVSFLNSGPNILKTSESYELDTKTKITNQINNATQSVEGTEATNAIVGVEIGKALKSVISSKPQQAQAGLITVTTTSNCKPSLGSIISCENAIVIK